MRWHTRGRSWHVIRLDIQCPRPGPLCFGGDGLNKSIVYSYMLYQRFNQVRRGVLVAVLALACASGISSNAAFAKGGASGGGSVSVKDSRVTGYATAINYAEKTISVGASYYGSGILKVTSTTKIQLNAESVDFNQIKVGDWVEARYDFATKVATKLEVRR